MSQPEHNMPSADTFHLSQGGLLRLQKQYSSGRKRTVASLLLGKLFSIEIALSLSYAVWQQLWIQHAFREESGIY